MEKKFREKVRASLNELVLRLQYEGCRKGMCETNESGQKILRDIPLEMLLDVAFIINKNIFLGFSGDLIGKSIEDLRNELHKILMTHFAEEGKHQDGKDYVDLVGYYGCDNTIRVAHFFSWALYHAAFEDMPDDFLDICIKIPYYITVASILSRGGISECFDFSPLAEKMDGYEEFSVEVWETKVMKYLSEAHEAVMGRDDQSAGTLKTLGREFEYLKLQMSESK